MTTPPGTAGGAAGPKARTRGRRGTGPGGSGPGGTRTLVVWCPDWPLVAAGILPDVPAAMFHANRVTACTVAARAEGVKRGLRRREAQSRCPGLVVEQHDPARDARAFEPVVAVVETFTPRVEVTRPGACALPTRGPSRYFGGDDALAARIREAVDAMLDRLPRALAGPSQHPPEGPAGNGGIPGAGCRVGVADGPFAAASAARRGLVVPPGGSAEFLAPLAIGVLGDDELTDLLLRLGLRTLGAFAALPASDVVGRFGPAGVTAHRRARGLDDRDLDCRRPSVDLTVEVHLDPPADRVDTAAFAAKSIADDLHGSLSREGLACACVRVEAETEHGEHLSRVWRHHRAFTPVTVAERVRWQLEGWLATRARCGCPIADVGPVGPLRPGRGVGPLELAVCAGGDACPNPVGGTSGGLTLIRLVPEQVSADDGRQRGFWGGTTEADDRAARGLARVQGLLGPEAVVTAVLGGGRGPAEQVRLVPWGDPREAARPGAPAISPLMPPSSPPQPTQPPGPTAPQPALPPSLTAPTYPPPSDRDEKRPRSSTRKVGARAGSRARTAGRSPSPAEVPVWPGRVPSPSPAVVLATPLLAEVIDVAGNPLGVTSRSLPTGAPDRLSMGGAPWEPIVAWAGPWTADERWWDPAAHRRLARFQVVLDSGTAHLLALEDGRWWVEATYD